jgi:hypothetical protein
MTSFEIDSGAIRELFSNRKETSMETSKCQHKGCNCSGSDVRPDGYCSDACKQQKMAGGQCTCGHSKCK